MSKEQAVAVGQIPSGLFIVCATDKENSNADGYLASWIQQVSFEPLLLCLAIKPGRPAYELIKSGNPFSINIVGDHESSYLKHFWKGYDPEFNPFSEIDHVLSDNNTINFKDAKAVIECRFVSSTQPGDHELVIAEVVNSVINNEVAKPKVHLRKNGLDY